MPGYRNLGRSYGPFTTPHDADPDLTTDDLITRREASTLLDVPEPRPAVTHIAYAPLPDLTFVPGYGYAATSPNARPLSASLRKARRADNRRKAAQIAFPIAVLLAGFIVSGFLPPS